MIADLVDVLDETSDLCLRADPPENPVDGDLVLNAALRLGASVLSLAARILEGQREWDAQADDRRPYPPSQPKPPQDPPPQPKPKPPKGEA